MISMADYYRRLDRALVDWNKAEMRALLMEGSGETIRDDKTLELSMHMARVERETLPRTKRLESVEWLRARGYRRRGGLDLPPRGELPR